MFGALVVLWLGSEPELAEHRAEVDAWAHARQRHTELLRPTAPAHDAALVDAIEALLEEARALPAGPGTPDALQRAEALLLEHPELPQAAWLLAERYAIEAHALAGGDDATAARRRELGRLALGLEGVRAAAVGAAAIPAEGSAARAAPPPGPRPRDRVFIDGMAIETRAGPWLFTPGRHHARVSRGALPVWSGWVTLEPGPNLPLADAAAPCSALDLADVGAGSTAPEPAPGIRCERWAVARPSLRGGVDLAECAGSRCEPWQQHAGASPRTTPVVADGAEPARGAWPGWATWGLIGAGALAATGIVLWQVGAFERDAPGTEFVFTGPSAPAYRF